MYAVFVMFQIKHHAIDDFLPAILENAARCLESDPECHQYDVCLHPDRRDEVYLYALFTSRAAFEAHGESNSAKIFDGYVAPMIAAKSERALTRISP